MTTKYFALLTSQGAAKLANMAALGTKLQITEMAVGDGGGTLPTPDTAQTKLISEWRRAALNSLSIDAANSSQIIAEQVIPESEGGFWIREIGLYDADGDLIAVANCPETYKPKLAEGSGRTQTVRMILIVNSTSAVTLKVDPAVVLATRKYADDKAAEARAYTDSKVIEVKAYADDKMAKHLAATDPHTQYAPKNSPELTGIPKVPTAAAGDNSTQMANTAFVAAAIAALTAAAPEALDTLKELADSLGNDPHFSTTVLNALAGKMDKAKNGSDIADVAAFVANLGLNDFKYGCPLIGELIYWPLEKMPHEIFTDMKMEFIPYMAQSFDGTKYPLLAKLHPSLSLPVDMRGEYARSWDNGRGVDSGHALLSWQGDAIRNITGQFRNLFVYSSEFNSGAFSSSTGGVAWASGSGTTGTVTKFDASLVVPTASENRVRNIAWNTIVRAK